MKRFALIAFAGLISTQWHADLHAQAPHNFCLRPTEGGPVPEPEDLRSRNGVLKVALFSLGRGREGPRKFLGRWEGILQTDGYQAYDGIGGSKLVHVGCGAHARRKFVDGMKVNPKDAGSVAMVLRMDALFAIDAEARKQGLNGAERLALRREHAPPSWITEIREACLGSGSIQIDPLPVSGHVARCVA